MPIASTTDAFFPHMHDVGGVKQKPLVTAGGGYAPFAAVAEDAVAAIPKTLSFAEAAGVPLTALTALQALRDKAQLQAGQHVLIYGASGGVGSFAVQIAKAMGAYVTAASSQRNLELVRSLGADEVVDYIRHDLRADTDRYAVIFDAVNALTFRSMLPALQRGGTFITVNPLSETLSPAWLSAFRGGRSLRSVQVQPSGGDLAVLGAMIDGGQLRPLIDTAFPVADAAAAQRYSATGRVRGKLVLVVDEALASSKVDMMAADVASYIPAERQ